MKFLVIGLGSMGKRRIRCLQSLGYNEISGFDLRKDRRDEAYKLYGIRTYENFSDAFEATKADAWIISVPPDVHHEYMKLAILYEAPFFVEASVVDTDMGIIMRGVTEKGIVAAPSATLVFHPAIKKVGEIVKSGEMGKISNVILHSGQYLPDWHSYERVNEYYVSNPATGGGREIVPFELSWITHLFGFPLRVCGNFRKTINIDGAPEIDDTYNFLMDYGQFLASITVDVVSRHAVRRLLINGEKKQLVWDWDINCVKIFDPESNCWQEISYEMKCAAEGYNANIGENMYIDEIENFIQAVKGEKSFVNTLADDHKVLKLLYAIEESDQTSQFVRI